MTLRGVAGEGWLGTTSRGGRISLIPLIETILKIATVISATATWEFAGVRKIGWGWTGVIWLFNLLSYLLLDPLKICACYTLSGKAWDHVLNNKTAFTNQKDFGREVREAAWAREQSTLHGLQSVEAPKMFSERSTLREINHMAEEAKRRAEIARLRELHTLKGW